MWNKNACPTGKKDRNREEVIKETRNRKEEKRPDDSFFAKKKGMSHPMLKMENKFNNDVNIQPQAKAK
jgi:hypothetical protein